MNKNYFIPEDKFDFEAIDRIKNADPIIIQPVLSQIFEWVEEYFNLLKRTKWATIICKGVL